MSYRYLLDTNIIADLMRNPGGDVYQTLLRCPPNSYATSIIVAAELRFGADKKQSKALYQRVNQLLQQLPVLPLEAPTDRHYAQLRVHLESQGTPIGPNDLLIAAQALALNLTIVTANVREFSRVPNLAVENWLSHD